MGTRSAVALVVLAVLASAAPSTARAASLSADRSCYSGKESMVLSGSGFTPDGDVVLRASGELLGTTVADSDGGISVRVVAPRVFGVERLRFVARDRADTSLTATTRVRIAATDVLLTPALSAPRRPSRIRAWGFIDVAAVYAHVRRGTRGRVRNIRLGVPRGPCGVLDVTRRLLRREARPGLYTVQFDALRRYVPGIEPSVAYLMALGRVSTKSSGY